MQSTEKDKFLFAIGERLKLLRKKKGYSNHEAFADDLDMTRSQYWEYENGKKNITLLTLKKILDKLKVEFTDFFSEGFNPNE